MPRTAPNLKAAGVKVIDRILGKGDIPHNKFMVLSENDAPAAVLSGSTNWTSHRAVHPDQQRADDRIARTWPSATWTTGTR